MNIVTVFMLFLSSCMAQEKTIELEIPDNFSGWGFLVTTSATKKIVKNSGRYVLNNNGVSYIDTVTFNNSSRIEFYRNDRILTEKDIKFFFSEDRSVGTENSSNIRTLYMFYILDSIELKKGDDYWRDENNRRPLRQKLYKQKDSLIGNRILIIE